MMGTDNTITGPIILAIRRVYYKRACREVIKLTGSRSKIIYLPPVSDDPVQRKPDISMAKSVLNGWEPKVALEEGLVKTISYFDELLKTTNLNDWKINN